MAYVSVSKDLSKIRPRLLLNLTKRQLICFSAAIAVGVPAYIFTRGILGNSGAALLMIGAMLPLFFIAMYEKDGQPAEVILRNYVRCKFYRRGKRPYRTENMYEIIARGGSIFAHESRKTAGAPVGKRPSGKGEPRRR